MKNMERNCVAQFAVITSNAQVVAIGKSVIISPRPCYNGNGIKWFDDSKLIHGGDAYKL